MGISLSRSLNPEITSKSKRRRRRQRYNYPKLPYCSLLLSAKKKGPLYDSHLAHTAYMNNVAKVRRSTKTPHSSQLLKPPHLLRRKSPNCFVKPKKTTSPVRCILNNPNRITTELITYENMDLLGFNRDVANDENCNLAEESPAKLCPLPTVCDIKVKAISGCNGDSSNKVRAEAYKKSSVQDVNHQHTPSLLSELETVFPNNYDGVCNNENLPSQYQNNATQTSASPSRTSNHSSYTCDDSELMKSVTFPRETAVFYMMHNEEASQEFSGKKRHGFCGNYSTSEEISQPSLTAHDYRSFQKRRHSKYLALESPKELHNPWKHHVYISTYQEAEKPLIDVVIKEESSEQMDDRIKLDIGDGVDGYCSPEKRKYALENTSSMDIERDTENNDGESNHSNVELQDDVPIIKILSRQEMVSSDYSGCLSWNSYEYQPKMVNKMRGKSEDGSTSTPRKVPDQVLHEQQLRNKPTSVGPNAALAKFHAHGDGFVAPRQHVPQRHACNREEGHRGHLIRIREDTASRHRCRHRVAPACPPSTPCSGVYSTQELRNKMVCAELREDSPLLTKCMVRRHRKPTSIPSAKKQEVTIGEPHSNETVFPEITIDINDDLNKCTDLKHASSLQICTQSRKDVQSSFKDLLYEEVNKIQSRVSYSNDEHKQNSAKGRGIYSTIKKSSSEQMFLNNRSTKEARFRMGSLASESGEKASAKLMQKSTENRNKRYCYNIRTQKQSDCRLLRKTESQPKCKLHVENKNSLHKPKTPENQSKIILLQQVVNQHDTDKSRRKQDKETSSCYGSANSDTPRLVETEDQNVACMEDNDKAHDEDPGHAEKPLSESGHCYQSTDLQLSELKAPQKDVSVYHCQAMRASATIGDPSNFCGSSSQSTQTVLDDVCKDLHPTPEKDDEEEVQQHISRTRHCPIHRQSQEEAHIPSLHSDNSDVSRQFQPQHHYCRIHHKMFTINVLPHEHHLSQNLTTMQERNDDPGPVVQHQQHVPKRDLNSLAPRCRSLVAMFERRKHVLLSGRNWKDEEDDDEDISTAMNGINGVNGHHGELNGGGDLINNSKGCWTIGLINSKFRYLTAETFGFKINANGASLKKKQVWTLEPAAGDSAILLRSHLDKYLAVDTFGNVTCETEERDDPGTKFQISVADDGTGRWALRNITRGYFLGASSDKLTCTAKVPGDAELWHVHLAARPQVNLRSVGRKRFAHLSENLDEIHVDANIPWGEDTLFTLEFRADDNGKYALHTCNNKYLSREGKLVDTCTPNCLFSAEYHSGQLALRDRTGAYLSPIGSKAVLKSRSTTVTKDELFSLEDSLPQASFVAGLNSRYVSVKQGVDVTANQDEISDHETFQLEFDSSTKRWYIRTMQDRYWTLETGGGIQASGDKRSSNALFDLVWQGDGSVSFRANNGKFVSTKRSGHLYANCDNVEDNSKYFFYLINRPILVLKCEQGFVGYKSASSPKLECNKATYETIQVERSEKGVVFFKGQNGKYWHVDGESVTADTDVPEGFFIELRDPTHICIKSTSGEYLVASKNGAFRLGDSDYENATKWEY